MEVPIYFQGHRGLQARVALQYIFFLCLVENPRAYSHRFFFVFFFGNCLVALQNFPSRLFPRQWISQNKRMASFATSLSRPRYSAHRVRVHDSVWQGQQ